MNRYDVVVVGGGPTGAVVAEAAARAGARVLIVERSPDRPSRCTGLVGPRTLDVLALPGNLILQEIRSVRLHAPNGASVAFDASEARGYVLDRTGLDRWLLARAEEAGGVVGRGVAALGLEGTVLQTSMGPVGFGVLVGADGAMSSVRRWANLSLPGEILVGPQAIVSASVTDGCVEMYLGNKTAPGGFAWVVPRTEDTVLVGLLTTDRPAANGLLDRFLSRRLPGARVWARATGLVPIGPPARCVAGRVIVVGDAAGQPKPLTGGGILFGALAGRIAGEVAARGPDALEAYEARWRAEIGPEIAFGLRARKAFLSLSDEDFDRVVPALDHPRLHTLVADHGDIDRVSHLARVVLGRPSAWAALIPLVDALGGWARVRDLVRDS